MSFRFIPLANKHAARSADRSVGRSVDRNAGRNAGRSADRIVLSDAMAVTTTMATPDMSTVALATGNIMATGFRQPPLL